MWLSGPGGLAGALCLAVHEQDLAEPFCMAADGGWLRSI
jgi:hypothetical protein